MKTIFASLLLFAMTSSAHAATPSLLDLLASPGKYATETTDENDQQNGWRVYVLNGAHENINNTFPCKLVIATDGERVDFYDEAFQINFDGKTHLVSILDYAKNMNNYGAVLNIERTYKSGTRVKTQAVLRENILKFNQSAYAPTFRDGLDKYMWSETCVFDLSKQGK